jgi:MFS transporter, DHA2 family, glioxin efflux transporter
MHHQSLTSRLSTEIKHSQSATPQSTEEIPQVQPTASKEAADDDQVEYPSGIHLLTVALALVLALLLAVVDMTILATAIPHITDEFHSLDDIGWYASVFFMTVASSQSTWGKAYKYFDLKTVFFIAIAVFELGSLVCGKPSSASKRVRPS